jgi:glucose-6-phosphate 1-dehydrogenase
MVQNHLFQLLTMMAMELPVSLDANAVRGEKSKLLKAVQPLTAETALTQAVRGQYGEGTMNEEVVPAYRSEPRVAADSTTETYVALKLTIDNWRWAGVPFYLRTGKRLPKCKS